MGCRTGFSRVSLWACQDTSLAYMAVWCWDVFHSACIGLLTPEVITHYFLVPKEVLCPLPPAFCPLVLPAPAHQPWFDLGVLGTGACSKHLFSSLSKLQPTHSQGCGVAFNTSRQILLACSMGCLNSFASAKVKASHCTCLCEGEMNCIVVPGT